MFLIRVQNEVWWFFNIKRRFQLVKTIRLSNHLIFLMKKLSIFLGIGGQKVIFNEWYKIAWKIHSWQWICRRSLIGVVLANFWRRVPLNFPRQDACFSTHMTIFWIIIFSTNKEAKLVEKVGNSPPSLGDF